MIDPEQRSSHPQNRLKVLEISSSSVYYQPRPVSEPDLWLMRRIDELHMNYPFARNRILRDLLWQQGWRSAQACPDADAEDAQSISYSIVLPNSPLPQRSSGL